MGATTAYPLVMHLLDLRDRGVAEPGDVTEALAQLLPPQPCSKVLRFTQADEAPSSANGTSCGTQLRLSTG